MTGSHQQPTGKSAPLSAPLLCAFALAKVLPEGRDVNSLDFSAQGEQLITASDDDSIQVYTLSQGKHAKTIWSKKYGCSLIRFTHDTASVLHCNGNSTEHLQSDALHSSDAHHHTVKYLSLHDNKYLRFFTGHTAPICSMAMHPLNDTFLTASLDSTVRIWDLRSNACHGRIAIDSSAAAAQQSPALAPLFGACQVAHDPEGCVFALACSSRASSSAESTLIKLYDSRKYEAGPFTSFDVSSSVMPSPVHSDSGASAASALQHQVTQVSFSPDGKYILVAAQLNENNENPNASDPQLQLLDAFSGAIVTQYSGASIAPSGADATAASLSATRPCLPCFSPCGSFVCCGLSDSSVRFWHTESGDEACVWQCNKQQPLVKWAPQHLCVATASKDVNLWLPDMNIAHKNEQQ